MSKKHFIALADALRRTYPRGDDKAFDERIAQWNSDVHAIACVCREFNPRFNADRWFGYINGECGPSGGAI